MTMRRRDILRGSGAGLAALGLAQHTTAGAGRSVDVMARRPQSVGDVLPHPTAMPSAVHQYEGGLLRGGRPAVVLGYGVLREAQCRQAGAAPAQ